MLTQEGILEQLNQKAGELKQNFSVRSIGLLGSLARNEADSQSDVDILVDFAETTFDHYTLMGIFLITLPLLFFMDFRESSTISPRNILIILLICWALACSFLLFKYKNYKKYIKDIS